MDPSLLSVIITTLLPVAELRGGIPLGLALGLDPLTVILTCFIVNCLVFFPVYIGLTLLYKGVFSRFKWARSLMNRIEKRGKKYIDRYGIPGLIIYVGIPLPVTGAWTGTAIAWLFRLDWKKSFLTICAGVAIATVIVSAITLGLFSVLV